MFNRKFKLSFAKLLFWDYSLKYLLAIFHTLKKFGLFSRNADQEYFQVNLFHIIEQKTDWSEIRFIEPKTQLQFVA